ncbi:MAG: carboxypeptidase-like regulatory domain-containing protein [Thermoplasmatales archaeon]|nr:carboxypeptidase-like regulatory domain-containing protein [Thermoplasmatales archaeon]
MLIMFFLQPADADIFIDSAKTDYSPVYDGNGRDVETTVDFHIDSDEEVYFKLLASNKNDALNEGWWVRYLVYDNNVLIKDLGNKSGNDATGYVSVSANKIYTLKAFVHLPGNLSVNQSYQCIILLCEHSGAGGGSGGTPDPNVKFTSYITLTTTYLIYGHVYDENKKPIPNIDVNITNMETGNSATTKTNNTGFYSYNLYNLGYHNNDRIMVSATYNSITGHNLTTVNIENNFSECDIVIPASVETEKPEGNQIIWVIAGMIAAGAVICVIIIGKKVYGK